MKCIFRSIGVTRFLSFHDLDEFVMPTSMHGLTALFFAICKGDIASYRIPARYFQLEEDLAVTLNNKKSVKRLDPLYTKCVVRPEMIFKQVYISIRWTFPLPTARMKVSKL
uniref:Glycosyltransferase family 92 protein n=1 Tax=Parascaris univalens TaxID=6257 RepID=A0A915A3P2_PARUN